VIMDCTDGPETASGKTEAVWVQDYPEECAYIYVGRMHPRFKGYRGLWGNPWSHLSLSRGPFKAETVEEAVDCYRRWLAGDPEFRHVFPERRAEILRRLPELRGKRLACWRHDGPCHAQVLAEMADADV
jgi:hypothetical protein